MKLLTNPLLHELFVLQAKQQPDAIAISSAQQQLTYRELAAVSQAIADLLIAQNSQPNQLVAVVMEKGWEQVAAVLGILMAGSAYLPIDPSESTERLHYLLTVGEVSIVLTQNKYKNLLSWPQDRIIIDLNAVEPQANNNFKLPQTKINKADLAYVIFTSGSTGVPKGVMISHQNAVNTILDINERFSLNNQDRVFALSSLSFDLSVYDIFGTLAAGGTIVLPDAAQAKDPTQWQQLFFTEKVSVWNTAPALMDLFTEYLHYKPAQLIKQHGLRLVLLSGDWIPLNLPQKIRSLFGKVQIISLGGATEAAIWSILYEITELDPSWNSIPYGRAMKNQAFYILDEKLKLIQNDRQGELYIGGLGVAQGYWRDSERSQMQFIDHPCYGKLYKTGDLGRYLADGNIEFLGRVDFQVKIAGYRVEINAIEKYLLDFPLIKQAVVLTQKDQAYQKLIAYLNFDYDQLLENQADYSAIQGEQVNYWQQVYNQLCQQNASNHTQNAALNTVGWNSSYHSEPIAQVQMQEWVENTVARISLLKPENILEIGCGTGMLLFRLAKIVKHYDATDFAKSAIDYVAAHLQPLQINNVNLIECEATAIKQLNKFYDTIILNSVVQYFPSIDHLVEVLNQCVSKIKDKGQIFIGDVRSLHLLNEFHASVLLSKNRKPLSYLEWQNMLAQAVADEDELVLDFNFFHAYKAVNARVSQVEILLKAGQFQNEMTCYRYDVILHINQPATKLKPEPAWQLWDDKEHGVNLEFIHNTLSQATSELLAIKQIPNKRTAALNHLLKHNNLAQVQDWLNHFANYTAKAELATVDPQTFYELAEHYGYQAVATWSTVEPAAQFDIIFVKKYSNSTYLSLLEQRSPEINCLNWAQYANQPLLPRINHKLITELKIFLQQRLPHYMIPNHFIPVKELPITANGKVDRKAVPHIIQPLAEREYVKAYTKTQTELVIIWQKLLNLQQIGIQHNFYELGGTSLLAIQLLMNIQQQFGIDLHLQELAACAINIENLSSVIEQKIAGQVELK